MGLKVKKILEETKGKTMKIGGLIKPLAKPVLLSPKVGWEVAKFGIEIAKKPLERLTSKTSEKVITELKIEDIKKMMMASAQKIVLHQEEINKINVWPVADKDTGYNLAATILGIEGTIGGKEYDSMKDLAKDIKEAAVINARGNAGMIYAGYLIKFLDEIKNLELVDAFRFSRAMKKGEKGAYQSIINPTEGTILDIISAAEKEAYLLVETQKEKNIIKILEGALRVSQVALKETKEKLKVLKENNVVDAGGLGFVKILEAWLDGLKGITPSLDIEELTSLPEGQPKEKLEYPYEIVSSFDREGVDLGKLKNELSSMGDSFDIIESENRIKFHIHTARPEEIKEKIKDLPKIEYKIEEMTAQPKVIKKKPLGIVIDDVADLPYEFVEKYQIEEVPLKVKFPDGEIITSREELYQKMREAVKSGRKLPVTSQPPFENFRLAYKKALEKFEKILVITITAKLSGTYSSARIARSFFKKPEKLNIIVFDSFTAEVAEGLVAIRAQELISQGKNIDEILEELKIICPQATILASIDDFRYVVHGGRVKLPRFLISVVSLLSKLGVRLLIKLKNGRIKFVGIKFGKNIANVLAKEIGKINKGKEIKVAIAHADNLSAALELKKELEKMPKTKVLFISSASPVVGAHTGPGTLLIGFYPV